MNKSYHISVHGVFTRYIRIKTELIDGYIGSLGYCH